MTERLPKYANPPLIESVISVQFAALPEFTDAHAGWYWKKCLAGDWPVVQLTAPIEDKFERFGAERLWRAEMPLLSFRPGISPSRAQFPRKDQERMIQLQATRFIYNWHKRKGEYPTFDALFGEFSEQFRIFQEFAADANLGPVQPNQWELTYVNHIPMGDLWVTPMDWPKVLPHFRPIASEVPGQQLDTFNGEWQYALDNNRGRLCVSLKRGRVNNDPNAEVMLLQQTARGPVDESQGWDLRSGLERGRKAIDLSFASMTDENVQKSDWQRTTL